MMIEARKQTKWEMVMDRGGIGATCDWCMTNVGTQMHEITSRSRTVKNPEARALSFDKHICALLCEECHAKYGHSISANTMMLLYNFDLYGEAAVRKAWDSLCAAMSTPPDIPFPGGE